MKKELLENIDIEQDFDLETVDLDKLINEVGEVSKTTNGAHIKLVNLSKKYEGNEKYTLENINLEIKPGTFCIFLGPSGCGKTTLLRMIAGLNSITKGDLLFNDKRYNNLLPNERNIAMVFQSYALYPHMNVYNNISFGLKIAKERKDIIDRRVKDVAKILKIDDYLYRKPRDLSGGQRQRVAIGRAIARKPLVFLMDEPLSNLDAKLRENMRREIVNIHRMLNTTSIYVTHDQLEAMTMGDQLWYLMMVKSNKVELVVIYILDQLIYSLPHSLVRLQWILLKDFLKKINLSLLISKFQSTLKALTEKI
ncbi:ABC transporter ATP-binding protein [Mycoplasma anserisalpingitidis]|uniref:ABC transporter ATP-binding protein n=1 Tax=Mycoplasma anserisalpingitidis TaxID=519450 RepID=UPI0030157689